MKNIIVGLVLICAIISGEAHAYYGQNSAATKYYSGEISSEEYVDSLVPQSHRHETTVYHSDGSKSLVVSGNNGGTVYHSNGSKSVYTQSRY